MRMSITILIISLTLSCSSTRPREGIKGQVFWVSENQLPGPDATRTAHYGVQRELYIYELTTLAQASLNEGFFSHLSTNLVTKVVTRPDGSFAIKLPPGKYSVFVKEDAGLFANLIDEHNAINPVTVKEKQYTWMPITVDYEATY